MQAGLLHSSQQHAQHSTQVNNVCSVFIWNILCNCIKQLLRVSVCVLKMCVPHQIHRQR